MLYFLLKIKSMDVTYMLTTIQSIFNSHASTTLNSNIVLSINDSTDIYFQIIDPYDYIEINLNYYLENSVKLFIDMKGLYYTLLKFDIVAIEIPNVCLQAYLHAYPDNIYLVLDANKRITCQATPKAYKMLFNGIEKDVYIGKLVEMKEYMECKPIEPLFKEPNIKAICKDSMILLDELNRKYLNEIELTNGMILGVNAVAGSGKTTCLLSIVKRYRSKRILYMSYIKSLVEEIRVKDAGLEAKTLDAIFYGLYFSKYPKKDIVDQKIIIKLLKESGISTSQISDFSKFCNSTDRVMSTIWNAVRSLNCISFEIIRKVVYLEELFYEINSMYDMLLIDESQDFDELMLQILLQHTTIPKVFVGDDRQAIYQFKGCSNAFDGLPKTSIIINLYSSYRVGGDICDYINMKLSESKMYSAGLHCTHITNVIQPEYVYLFRTWKKLLEVAQGLEEIYVHAYQKNKHRISSEAQYNIELNLVEKEKSKIQMYSVHAYKGLEAEHIRIASDITIEECNIWYVALTRATQTIYID